MHTLATSRAKPGAQGESTTCIREWDAQTHNIRELLRTRHHLGMHPPGVTGVFIAVVVAVIGDPNYVSIAVIGDPNYVSTAVIGDPNYVSIAAAVVFSRRASCSRRPHRHYTINIAGMLISTSEAYDCLLSSPSPYWHSSLSCHRLMKPGSGHLLPPSALNASKEDQVQQNTGLKPVLSYVEGNLRATTSFNSLISSSVTFSSFTSILNGEPHGSEQSPQTIGGMHTYRSRSPRYILKS